MRIMAIDYGDAHTGIAISDPTGLLAGFTTVINSRRQEVVVEQVTLLAKEHGAEELVLGHPVNMDGTLGPRCWRRPRPCRWSSGMSAAPPSTPTTSSSTAARTPNSGRR